MIPKNVLVFGWSVPLDFPELGEEGTRVAEICRKAGISQATYFNCKKTYSGMLPTDMKRLRALEEERWLTRSELIGVCRSGERAR